MQAQERPRFRHDLVAELVEEGGQRFIDVGDPDSGNTFRFYEVEYSLACAMDGERDVAGIVKWAQEELGLTPSPTEVQTVISTLADLRFIDTGAAKHVDRRPAAAAAAATAGAVASAVASTSSASAPATAPAKAPAKADGLAQGVVVAKSQPTAAPKVADVELGSAGSKSAPVADKLPAAPELELGAPGAAAAATPPKAPVEDIALGSPGASPGPAPAKKAPASEVSIDLAAHMEVKPDDVKDAVRQSKVMTAVEVPKDLLEAESPKAAPAAAVAKAEPAKAEKAAPKAEPAKAEKPAEKAPDKVAASSSAGADKAQAKADKAQDKADKAQAKADKAQSKADDKKADDKKADDKAAAAAAKADDKKADDKKSEAKKADDKKSDKKDDKVAAKPAVEAPSKRPATDKPVAPPAPRPRVSPVLVFTLILAVVGAGAFFVYKYVLNKPEEAAPQTKAQPVQPTPPPAPPEAKASVSAETPPAQEIKAPAAGTIESIEADGKDVKTGDVIATLAGGAPMQREIATLTKAVERTQAPVDAAQKKLEEAQAKENNEQGVTAAQAKLDAAKKAQADAQAKLDAKKADLDKLSIKATSDGKLTGAAKAKDAVTADQVIASVERPAMHVATFTLPADAKLPADGKLEVVAGGNPVDCTVIDQQVSTIKVQCPVEAVPAGTELTLKLTR